MDHTRTLVCAIACELAGQHAWAVREQGAAPLHPIVWEVIAYPTLPTLSEADCRVMAMHWPHLSKCGERVAFTPTPEYGERNRQQTTTVGKYLRKFYTAADLPDHVLRDLATRVVRKRMELTTDTTEWYRILKEGPRSCMSPTSDKWWSSFAEHPYRVYDPSLGWSMAVRYADDGTPMARALVYKGKYFVRTYRRHDDWPNGYSHADETLAVWLEDQGIHKLNSWADADMEVQIKVIPENDCIVAPYLDGNMQYVDIDGVLLPDVKDAAQGKYYICGGTSGWSSSLQYVRTHPCACCGQGHPEDVYEEDGIFLGQHGDGDGDWVGPCCTDQCVEVTDPRTDDTYWVYRNNTFTLVGVDEVYEDCRVVHRHLRTVTIDHGPYEGEYALASDCIQDINGAWWYRRLTHIDVDPVTANPELFDEE